MISPGNLPDNARFIKLSLSPSLSLVSLNCLVSSSYVFSGHKLDFFNLRSLDFLTGHTELISTYGFDYLEI